MEFLFSRIFFYIAERRRRARLLGGGPEVNGAGLREGGVMGLGWWVVGCEGDGVVGGGTSESNRTM